MFPYNQNMTLAGNIMPQNTYVFFHTSVSYPIIYCENSWKQQHFHLLSHCPEIIWILTVHHYLVPCGISYVMYLYVGIFNNVFTFSFQFHQIPLQTV